VGERQRRKRRVKSNAKPRRRRGKTLEKESWEIARNETASHQGMSSVSGNGGGFGMEVNFC
jgi:hypothetical protein